MDRIIIVGGGFAGVLCAKTLRKNLSPQECEIVLFDSQNHMVFHPLLAEVAGASIHPDAAAVPLRQMLPTVDCRTEQVLSIDFERKQVRFKSHDGPENEMSYREVVIACGGVVNLGLVPGMADHGFPLKTVGDAMALRSHIIQELEMAEVAETPERRAFHLHFIVVGGGFSGVEIAGEINDFARASCRYFHKISRNDIHVTLIHSRDQILPEISSKLREFARRKMEQAGIEMVLNARVTMATSEGVTLGDGKTLDAGTIVTTVGTAPAPLALALQAPKEKGFLFTNPDMRLQNIDGAWAIGDSAKIINGYDGKLSPATAQFAERQGRQAAENIVRVMRGQPTKPFYHRSQGQLCSIGGKRAVAEIMDFRLSGFLAWVVWRGVYLFKMPSWSRRVKVGVDWLWDLIFNLDLVYFKPNMTDRLSHAYYSAGDVIFRQGDPALNFYAIEKGEVEVVRHDEKTGEEKTIVVLGAGDFFGEMALLDKRPHSNEVRAKTPLRVLIMGAEAFENISESLRPLKDMLIAASRKRRANLWQNFPAAQDVLANRPLSEFREPLPSVPVSEDWTFAKVLELFNAQNLEFVCVVGENQYFKGVVTRTDLFRAFGETDASIHRPVRDFMAQEPLSLTMADPTGLAVEIMRNRQFKWLPILESREQPRLAGYVRVQKLLEIVVDHISKQPHQPTPTPTPVPAQAS